MVCLSKDENQDIQLCRVRQNFGVDVPEGSTDLVALSVCQYSHQSQSRRDLHIGRSEDEPEK
jgi:hypothetical protein